MDTISIEGHRQRSIAVPGSSTAVVTDAIRGGVYHIYSDVDVFLRVASPDRPAGEGRAEEVQTSDGYRLFAGNMIPIRIPEGYKIGVTSASPGTFFFHRVG